MFTIKAVRRGIRGDERVDLYEAHTVEVGEVLDEVLDQPGGRAVYWHDKDGHGQAIEVTSDDPRDEWDYPIKVVYIENAAGQTTEIVRPNPPQ